MSVERRLAAILFTDVVGYTALMGRDEAAGRRVRAQVERYHGSWIEEKGDESLSVFPSALEAVNCALALQAELEGDSELSLRIGVHLGDVTLEGGRVYGYGVNVAARIRPLAEPGGIVVSGPVHDSIKNQPGISALSQGKPELKNVSESVTVWSLPAGAMTLMMLINRDLRRGPGVHQGLQRQRLNVSTAATTRPCAHASPAGGVPGRPGGSPA